MSNYRINLTTEPQHTGFEADDLATIAAARFPSYEAARAWIIDFVEWDSPADVLGICEIVVDACPPKASYQFTARATVWGTVTALPITVEVSKTQDTLFAHVTAVMDAARGKASHVLGVPIDRVDLQWIP